MYHTISRSLSPSFPLSPSLRYLFIVISRPIYPPKLSGKRVLASLGLASSPSREPRHLRSTPAREGCVCGGGAEEMASMWRQIPLLILPRLSFSSSPLRSFPSCLPGPSFCLLASLSLLFFSPPLFTLLFLIPSIPSPLSNLLFLILLSSPPSQLLPPTPPLP